MTNRQTYIQTHRAEMQDLSYKISVYINVSQKSSHFNESSSLTRWNCGPGAEIPTRFPREHLLRGRPPNWPKLTLSVVCQSRFFFFFFFFLCLLLLHSDQAYTHMSGGWFWNSRDPQDLEEMLDWKQLLSSLPVLQHCAQRDVFQIWGLKTLFFRIREWQILLCLLPISKRCWLHTVADGLLGTSAAGLI